MTNSFSTKLAALGAALLINASLLGSVAYLFDGHTARAGYAYAPAAFTKAA
jgi:hypothetical protein